jgi:hypothetical protein
MVTNWQNTDEKSNPWPKRRLAFRTAIQNLDYRAFVDVVTKYGIHHSIEALTWDSVGGPETERLIELCVYLADEFKGKVAWAKELQERNNKLNEEMRAKLKTPNSGDGIPF